jgi:hypothetical protein
MDGFVLTDALCGSTDTRRTVMVSGLMERQARRKNKLPSKQATLQHRTVRREGAGHGAPYGLQAGERDCEKAATTSDGVALHAVTRNPA